MGDGQMRFEHIGGSARCVQYSLYDFSTNPSGETVMSLDFNRESKTWWFVGEPKDVMTIEHMQALQELLQKLVEEEGE